MKKLNSLVGMQLPEKYKENFDVTSEGPSSGITQNVKILLIFSGSCIDTNESLFKLLTLPTLEQTIRENSRLWHG